MERSLRDEQSPLPAILRTGSCGRTHWRTMDVADHQRASAWAEAVWRHTGSPRRHQAAFRVQSPWSIKNPNGDNPNEEEVLKPVCFVFDFAPTRALRQLSEYGIGLSPNEPNPENAVKDLVSYLPVLAYDGANMTQIDAGGILDMAMAGTSA